MSGARFLFLTSTKEGGRTDKWSVENEAGKTRKGDGLEFRWTMRVSATERAGRRREAARRGRDIIATRLVKVIEGYGSRGAGGRKRENGERA